MERLSSPHTSSVKHLLPFLFIGVLVFMAALFLFSGHQQGRLPAGPLFGIVCMLFFAALFVFKPDRELADEVWDDGDSLLIKRGAEEVRIPLAQVRDVEIRYAGEGRDDPRIDIILRTSSQLGDRITFKPASAFLPWQLSPLIDDLIARVRSQPVA